MCIRDRYMAVWLYMVVSGCIWLYMVVYGCIWLYMAVHGRIWLIWLYMAVYMAAYGCIYNCFGCFGLSCIWLYMVVYGYIYGCAWLYMAIYGCMWCFCTWSCWRKVVASTCISGFQHLRVRGETVLMGFWYKNHEYIKQTQFGKHLWVTFFDCMASLRNSREQRMKSTCPTLKKMRFPSPQLANQVTESALNGFSHERSWSCLNEIQPNF